MKVSIEVRAIFEFSAVFFGRYKQLQREQVNQGVASSLKKIMYFAEWAMGCLYYYDKSKTFLISIFILISKM